MSRILDNRIREIIDAVNTDKRRVHMKTDSLNTKTDSIEDEEPTTLEDLLAEDRTIVSHRQPPISHPSDLQINLTSLFRVFSNLQIHISKLLMEGRNISETSKILGIKRTTLNREIARMRKIFRRKGFNDYL
jgi:DNA-directed RNA polymerase specialized sigma24 family protein